MDFLQATPEGGFQPIQDIKGSPVPIETALANVRDSALFKRPIFTKQAPRQGSLIFVAGGPTLLDHLEEVRARYEKGEYILTSNNTHDFLVDNGIIPSGCLIFDPKKRVAEYVKKPQRGTTYFIGVTCVKEVFENLRDYNVQKVLIAYGMDGDEDLRLQQVLYPESKPSDLLVGGTMTPLRAMPFGCMLGFPVIEYYGMDSCFSDKFRLVREGEPEFNEFLKKTGKCYDDTETNERYVIVEPDEGGCFYAYKKDRKEDIHIAKVGSRRFLTSPAFCHQAKQMVYWMNRLESKIEVVIHGDNMTAAVVLQDRQAKAYREKTIGTSRWTPEYERMQLELYSTSEDKYGASGDRNFELVSRALLGMYGQRRKTITWLDYACGSGKLGEEITKALKFVEVTYYDPFHPKFRGQGDPGMHDFISCMDVMEHVEEQCVDNTINYIADRCRYGAMFLIATTEALKTLPDGRNAHITIKTSQWWKERLSRRFQVIEHAGNGFVATFVVAALGASERLEEERKAA